MKRLVKIICIILVSISLLAGCFETDKEGVKTIEKARHEYVSGYYSQARDIYESYLKNYPQGEYRIEAWNKLIDIAVIMNNNLDKGIELTEAMLLESGQGTRKSMPVLKKLGDLYLQRGNDQKALEAWQRCLDLRDVTPIEQAEIFLKISKMYREMASYDFAIESLTSCIGICKESEAVIAASGNDSENGTNINEIKELKSQALYQLAQNAIFLQNWDYAESILEELIDTCDKDNEVYSLGYFMLADVYEHKREIEKARDALLRIKDTYPNPNVVKARLKSLE